MAPTLAWIAACALIDVVAGLAIWRLYPAALSGLRGAELLPAMFMALLLGGWAFCLYRRPARHLLPGWLARMEWRVATILIATGLSLVPTLVGFFLNLQDENGGFTKDLFAGWVVIVAVVSLVSAAREDFDARARVLVTTGLDDRCACGRAGVTDPKRSTRLRIRLNRNGFAQT